jgi:hypothetical protein
MENPATEFCVICLEVCAPLNEIGNKQLNLVPYMSYFEIGLICSVGYHSKTVGTIVVELLKCSEG